MEYIYCDYNFSKLNFFLKWAVTKEIDSIKKLTDFFYFRVIPRWGTCTLLFSFGVTEEFPTYNAGNTAGFSHVVEEHFKVGCPS